MKKLTSFLCAFALTSLLALAADNFPAITTTDLKQAIAQKKVTLIDVNGSDSFKAGHIPGAIDFATANAQLAAKLPADKAALIVAYCGNEHCGAYARAAAKAKELGYTNVQHYSPGIAGWKKAGEKTDSGN
jgi:rhodanese-related sulfurtransferase